MSVHAAHGQLIFPGLHKTGRDDIFPFLWVTFGLANLASVQVSDVIVVHRSKLQHDLVACKRFGHVERSPEPHAAVKI